MIDEELLISYLQEQKRQYQEQMIALHRKVENFSTNNNEQEYIITAMCDSIASIIQVHTDLIGKIKNKEFDVQMPHSLSTDTIPVNEMENIGQEKSIPIEGQLRGEITLLKECRRKVCQQLVDEQLKNVGIQNFLNDLYEAIDEHYTEALENNDESAIVRAKTELDLITKLLDGLDKI